MSQGLILNLSESWSPLGMSGITYIFLIAIMILNLRGTSRFFKNCLAIFLLSLPIFVLMPRKIVYELKILKNLAQSLQWQSVLAHFIKAIFASAVGLPNHLSYEIHKDVLPCHDAGDFPDYWEPTFSWTIRDYQLSHHLVQFQQRLTL